MWWLAVIMFKEERVRRWMRSGWRTGWLLMLLGVFLLGTGSLSRAQDTCPLDGQLSSILQGFEIAPVPLDLKGKNPLLAGLGSYIVNAQGACNDCHTEPAYAPGGNPFLGEPEQINTEGYMQGGRAFGPFISRNITPCDAAGQPAGLTLKEFITVMRTGVDLKDAEFEPPNTPILQTMPWVVYTKMTDCDLQAIYEYLRALPPTADCAPRMAN
jgi:hypothetical protein